MCGIAGVYGRADEGTLEAMLSCLTHRGPDESGRHRAPESDLLMGMQRLSIVDLEGGSQPIYNEDGDVAVVFNGEIYNYDALRADLEERGHHFTTDADTEVLVHLYEDHGERTPEFLNGMFAFSVWDDDADTLFLARDRLGIKPLYYATDVGPAPAPASDRNGGGGRDGDGGLDGGFAWGSELPALAAAGVDRTLDGKAVYNFFSLRYSPGPRTMFASVRKLEPGTSLTVSPDGVDRRRYWSLEPRDVGDPSLDRAASRVRDLLEASVERRLMADVPVGAFLSGGLDSSAVTGFAARHHDDRLRTFSVGFPGADQDESDEAAFVADHFGTDHHRLDVDLSSMDVFSDLVTHFGEPLADPAALPTMLLSRYARERVKVVLTGEGADELFAGYRRHRLVPRHRRLARHVPRPAFAAAAAWADSDAPLADRTRRYARYAASLESDERAVLESARRYGDVRPDRYLDTDESPDSSGLTGMVETALAGATDEPLDRLCSFDLRYWLPDDLLFKVDHASMAASLEARVPFLDHELVEYAYSLPARHKSDGYKRVLSRAVADLVPERTRERAKHGFDVPVSAWFRGEHDAIERWLTDDRLDAAPYVDRERVYDLWADHRRGRADHGVTLWKVLTYVAWYHEHAR